MVIAMPLWFGSCKKNNADGGGDPVTPNSIEGSWKVSGMKINDGKTTEDYLEIIKAVGGADAVTCLTDTKITFNSNGTITGVPSPSCKSTGADEYNPAKDNSTWKTTGNKLTITDSESSSTYDFSVNSNTMNWIIQEQNDVDDDGVKETYTTTIEFKRV